MAQVRIFVSHSHQDNAWCRPMVAALKAVGYDVWYDETGLTGGDAWVASIQREVQARDVFLLVLSPEAWASKWVQDELQLAIATRRRILPVLLRNTQVDGFLLTTQWVTVIGEEPQVAARSIILAIEAPPAPGRGATPPIPTETLDDLITLCKSLLTEKRYTEALSACDRALALGPDNIDVLLVKGTILDQIGQKARAAAVFARALFRIVDATTIPPTNPWDIIVRTINETGQYVIEYSDSPATIIQVYQRTCHSVAAPLMQQLPSSPGDLTSQGFVRGGNPADWLPAVISRLSDLGAQEAIAHLISEYNGDGKYMSSVFDSLAYAGLVDPLLELGARLHMEQGAIQALVQTGHLDIDAVMLQVMRLTDQDVQGQVLDYLDQTKRYEVVDRLCHQWFGYPPSHPLRRLATYSEIEALFRCYSAWSRALEQLGQRREAATVRKAAERLRR